jgi:SAM-dependent methyltransferase
MKMAQVQAPRWPWSGLVRQLRRQLKWLFRLTPTERRHSYVGNAKLWQMKRSFQIQFLKRVGLLPHHFLLDMGCGTLRGGIPIIDYLDCGHYFGVEARPHVLAEGEKELREAKLTHKQPTLIALADPSQLRLEQAFDCIWAFSVLIHMSDAILDATLACVRHHLKDDGRFLANVNIGECEDGRWQGFPVVHRSMDFYEGAAARHGLRVQDLGPLTDFGHVLNRLSLEEQAGKRMLQLVKA